ncbi:UNVERIFIED_CONTAM: Microtubule-associated protein 70-5 [Sesamum calycinum]|uniref:Microtubule-associated protein 70-5 n=1 Tax=Sesamum calycinum TaxID=2727403 RepID=A0AAW2Q5T1_9LAMI
MPGLEELGGEDVSLVSHPDPVVLELNRLQNQLKEKERELGKAQSEIRALRATEVLKDKALEELGSEVKRLEGKLRSSENYIEQKNLDIKKLMDEKKEALAAQYAAEATLRRVYANKKMMILFPLTLQEDKRALERLTKSKEAALLEAERILRSALERALIVEEVQNQNFELRRQIEICQEENKILDKTNRQKVLEVEKLSQSIEELEEAILAGGAAANTIRDYRRQISELNEEKRTLERELARVKVSANRIATVVANEWKDEKDKVMPVKQWLEERRMLQAEMQKLKDKLAISERAAKAEAQVKVKLYKFISAKRFEPIKGKFVEKEFVASRNKVIDNSEKENAEMNKNAMVDDEWGTIKKEVISLRKFCDLKDSTLNSKDEEIKMLMKKIETLTRAMEVESKKMKREAAIREKDSALTKVDEKIRSTNSSKRSMNAS